MKRLNITSGAQWEDIVGYSRAVRVGNVVEVAGLIDAEMMVEFLFSPNALPYYF